MIQLGPYRIDGVVFVAPMAGVTDRPFRKLCKTYGAAYAVSEMVTSKPELWKSLKTSRRLDHTGEPGPIAVQIAGTEAQMLADAASYNMDRGAQIIDINMGCPAKKVCQKWAGSALMQNETLAISIIEAVVSVCAPRGVPVTLKMRTGWSQHHKNAVKLAIAAEQCGVSMITVHGRTREQAYGGHAEYETITQVKQAVNVPVVANGDLDSPEKIKAILHQTGVDAVMIGRAAMGKPWIFSATNAYLLDGRRLNSPDLTDFRGTLMSHLQEHYGLYGEQVGVRSARKHLGWYLSGLPDWEGFRSNALQVETAVEQMQMVNDFLEECAQRVSLMPSVFQNAGLIESSELGFSS